MRQEFGGIWTEHKLSVLKEYLVQYMRIMRRNQTAKRFLRVTYLDGFAGSGSRYVSSPHTPSEALIPWAEDFGDAGVREFYKGSPRVVLELDLGDLKPFDCYIFVEKHPEWVKELKKLKQEFPDRDIQIVQADCNSFVREWCDNMDWNDRALVFLDPYGMQIEWQTVERLAETRLSEKTGKVDVWMLVPVGAAIMRMLKRNEEPPAHWRETLNRFFGTEEWLSRFYSDFPTPSLPLDDEHDEEVIRTATFREITNFVVERLKTIFPGVLDEPAVFRNSKNVPLYVMCFATSNPKPSVIKAALGIARHIVKGFK